MRAREDATSHGPVNRGRPERTPPMPSIIALLKARRLAAVAVADYCARRHGLGMASQYFSARAVAAFRRRCFGHCRLGRKRLRPYFSRTSRAPELAEYHKQCPDLFHGNTRHIGRSFIACR